MNEITDEYINDGWREYDKIPNDEIDNVDELNINYNNSKNYLFFGHQYRFQNYVIDSINSLLPKDKKIQKCSVRNIICISCNNVSKKNTHIFTHTHTHTHINTYMHLHIKLQEYLHTRSISYIHIYMCILTGIQIHIHKE